MTSSYQLKNDESLILSGFFCFKIDLNQAKISWYMAEWLIDKAYYINCFICRLKHTIYYILQYWKTDLNLKSVFFIYFFKGHINPIMLKKYRNIGLFSLFVSVLFRKKYKKGVTFKYIMYEIHYTFVVYCVIMS